ncbi:3-isopropylmalate dehydratase, small subunit [Leptospira inadai serovar Lyme str. 10]|uniref:3-isopropylmalate dehydratase small subunit n=2 Tax=Leptospira inadai serovar Lyme TaxID=293084 RepID=V6HKY8_9LEPT|nr:3-isopropylmalate dehydratase small subunit [Leptospira inadai]EQA37570.1 3-isopropylmalate dehydratase, small subunit [Leptospira inadai serovar Lyme str. 10]PNV73283.1 3-isopropylmalate dehydratase small subunit [Leptospira inadai serovar Lyme]
MKAWTKHTGVIAPLYRADIDTDQILPKQFMKKIDRTGFGRHLFHDWRYSDPNGEIPNGEFILNKPDYREASILLTGPNFGCGSSREHAPWALSDFGIRVIIAPSFADIFSINCPKNGIALVVLNEREISLLQEWVRSVPKATATVDLGERRIGFGGTEAEFSLDENSVRRIRNGWDDIDLTLKDFRLISRFEDRYFQERSYLRPFR